MWSISSLKTNAKSVLKNYYWKGVAVCLIFGVLIGTISTNTGINAMKKYSDNDTWSEYEEIFEQYMDPDKKSDYDFDFDTTALITPDEITQTAGAAASAPVTAKSDYDYSDTFNGMMAAFAGIFIVVMIIAIAVASCWSIFFTNVLTVGSARFFIESRYHETGIGDLFSSFTGGRYKNTVKTMFFYDLYIWAWSLLFVIPGIIKTYEYWMVPYLIAENPTLDTKRAFEISKRTMDGEKMNCFLLQLSFIGWNILSAFTPFNAGYAFLQPYKMATYVEFYTALKAKAAGNSIVYPGEILDDDMRASGSFGSFNASPAGFGSNAGFAGGVAGGYNPTTAPYGSQGSNMNGQGYDPGKNDPFGSNNMNGQGYNSGMNNPYGSNNMNGAPQGYQGGMGSAPSQGYPGGSMGAAPSQGSYPSGTMDSISPQNTYGMGSAPQDYKNTEMDSIDSVNVTDDGFADPAIGESSFTPGSGKIDLTKTDE